MRDYIPQLRELRDDTSLPIYQTNVVFLVPDMAEDKVGRQFIYSILDKRPKRARVYWFVHVEVTDEPYTKEYQVDNSRKMATSNHAGKTGNQKNRYLARNMVWARVQRSKT